MIGKRFFVFIFLLMLVVKSGFSQVLELYEGATATATPIWVNCIAGNDTTFTVTFATPNNLSDSFYFFFGDGTDTSGVSLAANDGFDHTYTSSGNYAVTFIAVNYLNSGNDSTINGEVINIRPVSGSIMPPLSITYGCAPHYMCFRDSSFFVSDSTTLTWEFGDGTQDVLDATQSGLPICHTYLAGNSDCGMTVTLTAENECGTSISTWSPVNVYDIDDAAIEASFTILCYPDTTVTFQNISDMNCLLGQRNTYWDFGDGTTMGWTTSLIPFDHDFPGLGTYTVMMIDSNACGSDTAYINIQIISPPVAALSLNNDTICQGGTILFDNDCSGPGDTYYWDFGDGTGWITTTSTTSWSHAYSTPGSYTATIAVDVAGGSSCTDTATLDIMVLQGPTSNFSYNKNNQCDSMTVAFTDLSLNAVQWLWDFGNGNTDTNALPPAQFYSSPADYTVTLDVTGNNGCTDTKTSFLTVRPSPVVSMYADNVCKGQTASFFDSSTVSSGSITSRLWAFGDGGTDNSQFPTYVYNTEDTFYVVLSVSTNWCTTSDSMQIVIEPLPVPDFSTSADSGCPPLSIDFTNLSTGATIYQWDFGDGSGGTGTTISHIFSNNTTTDTVFSVKLIVQSAFGCSDSISRNMKIFTEPQADFTSNAQPGCSPLAVQFSNLSQYSDSYVWDFGDGASSSSTDVLHNYYNDTLYITYFTAKLTAINSSGCIDSDSTVITVYPLPSYAFEATPNSSCHPVDVSLVATPGGENYDWNFGDGSFEISNFFTSHTFTNTTTKDTSYTIQLIITNFFSCIDTVNNTILVHPSPTASFTLDTINGCTPFEATITNTSTGANNYYWSYGDGSEDTISTTGEHNHTYTNSGSMPESNYVDLTVESSDGCTNSIRKTLTVNPKVNAGFSSDTVGCSPLSVDFINQSYGAATYSWSFGDGATSSTALTSHIYSNNGSQDTIFTAQLIAYSAYNCSDTVDTTIIVYLSPTADFYPHEDSLLYPDTIVSFTNSTSTGPWTYKWSFGDGSSSSNENPASHPYQGWGIYSIGLVVSSSHCSDSTTKSIRIYAPKPIASFEPQFGSACMPFTVPFINKSSYGNKYYWDFGDNSGTYEYPAPQDTVNYTFDIAGDYFVTLIVEGDGGSDTKIFGPYNVYQKPIADFGIDPSLVKLPDQKMRCINSTDYGYRYYWEFGDGASSTEEDPSHQYTSEGKYDIYLKAWSVDGCIDSITKEEIVTVEAAGKIKFPNAFTPSPNGSLGCEVNDITKFNNTVFSPVQEGVVDYQLLIFNRWGELLFESKDIDIGWDGYYKDKLCKQDVYIWKVSGKYSNGEVFKEAGDLTLLR